MKHYKEFRKILIRITLPICLALILGLFIWPGMNSNGQQSDWSVPERLSAKGLTSWFPDIAVDPSGKIHVVWSSGVSSYDLVYYYAILPDGSRQGPIEIRALEAKAGSEATRAALFASSDGLLHMTYRDVNVFYSHAPDFSANTSRSWSDNSKISEGYFSRIAVDSRGKIHLVFTRNVISGFCPICYHLFYRWSSDGGITWSDEVDISGGPSGGAKPQIIIDKLDNPHVIWESGIGGSYGQLSETDPTQIMYVNSIDGGTTWEDPLQLSPNDMVARNPTLGLDGNGKLIAAWMDTEDDTVYFQVSDLANKSWSVPIKIPGIKGGWSQYHGRTDGYSMASDAGGNVHLVLSGNLSDNSLTPTSTPELAITPTQGTEESNVEKSHLFLLHMAWNGQKWVKPDIIASYTGDVPEWPRIAVGLGNQLHVVWFTRAEKDVWKGGGNYIVWYATKTTNAPAQTPIFLPTPSSSLTPDLNPATLPADLASTPEVIVPSVDVKQAPTGQLVYTEMDYLSIAAVSTLPVILFVVGFIFVAKKLRR